MTTALTFENLIIKKEKEKKSVGAHAPWQKFCKGRAIGNPHHEFHEKLTFENLHLCGGFPASRGRLSHHTLTTPAIMYKYTYTQLCINIHTWNYV
jgi:hypothetical protein